MNVSMQELDFLSSPIKESTVQNKTLISNKQNFDAILQKATAEKPITKESNSKKIASSLKTNQNDEVQNKSRIKNKTKNLEEDVTPKKGMVKEIPKTEKLEQLEKLLGCTLEEWVEQRGLTIGDLLQPTVFQQLLQEAFDIEDSMEILLVPQTRGILDELKTQMAFIETQIKPEKSLDLLFDFEEGTEKNNIQNVSDNIILEMSENNLEQSIQEEIGPKVEMIKENIVEQESLFSLEENGNKVVEKTSMQGTIVNPKEEGVQTKEDLFSAALSGLQNSIDTRENQQVQEFDIAKVVSSEQRVETDKLIQQITTHIKIHMKPDVSEMSLRLKPEYLGNVALKLVSDKGIVTAQILVENQQVKEMVESQLYQVRQTLANQGISVEEMQVSLQQENSQHSAQQQQMKQQKSRKRIQQIIDKNIKTDLSEEEILISEKEINQGYISTGHNQVDYSA